MGHILISDVVKPTAGQAVAALRADRAVTIRGAESVAKSYPEFFEALEQGRS